MEIYNYNQYGYYCGKGFADESPLELGVFLIPALSTNIEPPTLGDNQLIRFCDGCWTIITQLYCYYDNGFKSKIVNEEYIPIVGEIVFVSNPTVDELNEVFPLYNSGVPILTLDEQIEAIEAKYNLKFKALEKRLTAVFLSDGIDQEAKTIILQNEYKELSAQKDLEILEVFGGT